MNSNFVFDLLANALDLLTGGSLDYKEPHGRDESRIDAGLRLVTADAVQATDTPGVYLVKSDDRRKAAAPYVVCAEWGSLSCTCEDATISSSNPTGICKHQLAAVTMEAMRLVFAQMEAYEKTMEETQRSAA
jgi:hypothetical protein